MTYSDLTTLKQHLDAFIEIAKQTPCPSDPVTIARCKDLWRDLRPDSKLNKVFNL